MATPPLTLEVTSQQWDDAVKNIRYLSTKTIQNNIQLQRRIAALEHDLAAWRDSHAALQDDARHQNAAQEGRIVTLHKQIDSLQSLTSQAPLILCVLDGNSFLYHQEYLLQGLNGGKQAAHHLTESIADFLAMQGLHNLKNLSFWITIYHCRNALLQTVLSHGICSKEQFEAFFHGFSLASARFSVVDVGDGDDSASAKIAEQVLTFTRFPQTLHVFLGAGRRERYHDVFTTLESEQYLGKIVLLQKDDYANHSLKLAVQVLKIDRLFHLHDLPIMARSANLSIGTFGTTVQNGGLVSPQSPEAHTTRNINPSRLVDPRVPLHKQCPPPCNEHYLMSCSKGASCKYSHDYLLTPAQLQELATNAKKAPCNWLKNGLACPYNTKCCWGHRCPSGPRCFHLSKGKCWFKGETMHRDLTPEYDSGKS